MIYWFKKIISLMQNSDQKKLAYKRFLKIVGGGACLLCKTLNFFNFH